MSYAPITDLSLGKFLQIAYSDGIRNQISMDFRDFELIKRARVGDPNGRQLNFLFQTSFGPAATQYRNPGATGAAALFPRGQQVSSSENTAVYKEIDTTIEIEYNLWNRAKKSPAKYLDPLANEITSKTYTQKRRMAADLYADGTGVVGQLPATAASVTSPASDKLVFQLATTDTARGHVGFFEFDDILILRDADASATALDTSLATEPVYWKVTAKDRKNNRVTLQGLNASFASAGTISSVTTQAAAGAVFYRFDQPTIPDLTASISDYGTVTEVIAGLESLVAADGRVIHGITMSGTTGGSVYDNGAAALDISTLQAAMDAVKINVGQSRYKWPQMLMAPEAHATFVESRETDRRFTTVEDNKRGVRYFAFVHGNDTLETVTGEYVPKNRIYCLPEGKVDGHKVLESHLSDFEQVKANDSSAWMLKPSADGRHERAIVSYMTAIGVLLCNHPAAVAQIRNFTL